MCGADQLRIPEGLLQEQLWQWYCHLQYLHDLRWHKLGESGSVWRLYLVRLRCSYQGGPNTHARKVLRSEAHRTIHGIFTSIFDRKAGNLNEFILRKHVCDYYNAHIRRPYELLHRSPFELHDVGFHPIFIHRGDEGGWQCDDSTAWWYIDSQW